MAHKIRNLLARLLRLHTLGMCRTCTCTFPRRQCLCEGGLTVTIIRKLPLFFLVCVKVIEERTPILRVAADKLNKQSWTAVKG